MEVVLPEAYQFLRMHDVQSRYEFRLDHDDENFACRRSSTRSFFFLLSTFIGSDKPYEFVRGS